MSIMVEQLVPSDNNNNRNMIKDDSLSTMEHSQTTTLTTESTEETSIDENSNKDIAVAGTSLPISFINRVTSISMVNATLGHLGRYYANGRNSSRILDFGANTIEYSANLVNNTVGSHLRTLDNYAGRQLDNLESKYTRITTETPKNVVNKVNAWRITKSMRIKLEQTVQSLHNAETFIDFLITKLRNSTAQMHEEIDEKLETWSESIKARELEAEGKAQKLRENVSREVTQTLRNVVGIINNSGTILPLPAQATLKAFLLTLPQRFEPIQNCNLGTAKVIIMANDATVLIKSLINVISQYLAWSKPLDQES